MKRLTSLGNGLKGLSKVSVGLMIAAAFGAAACDEEIANNDVGSVDPELGVNFEELGTALTPCTEADSTDSTDGYDAATKTLNINLTSFATADLVVSVVTGKL